jgi:hypothetical protein
MTATANRYVTENRACQEVANPKANTPSATPNVKPDIALADNPSSQRRQSGIAVRKIDAPGRSPGTTQSPYC